MSNTMTIHSLYSETVSPQLGWVRWRSEKQVIGGKAGRSYCYHFMYIRLALQPVISKNQVNYHIFWSYIALHCLLPCRTLLPHNFTLSCVELPQRALTFSFAHSRRCAGLGHVTERSEGLRATFKIFYGHNNCIARERQSVVISNAARSN